MILGIRALLVARFGLIGDRQCGMDYRCGERKRATFRRSREQDSCFLENYKGLTHLRPISMRFFFAGGLRDLQLKRRCMRMANLSGHQIDATIFGSAFFVNVAGDR